MTTLREAAQQALEAVEAADVDPHSSDAVYRAVVALRAALEEPVQEPVAWLYEAGADRTLHWHKPPLYGTPLYTAPPQRQPLTEVEIEMAYREIWRDLPTDFDHTSSGWIEQGIKYAERAHGIGEAK